MRAEYRRFLLEGERAGARFEIAAPQRPPQGAAGAHMGRLAGSSLEFKDHREYQAGDDLRHIDWSAYARSDRLIVKLYREEVSPHVDLLLDASRSMALAGTAKARAALGLSAALASAAASAGFSHRLWLTGQGCQEAPNGAERPSAWEGIDLDAAESPEESLHRLPPRWRPQGIRILLSDLLWLGDPMATLARLSDQASAVFVVQILAEEDADPGLRGNLRLADCESGEEEEIFVDAVVERRYRDTLAAHQQNWSRACRQVGASMITLIAEELVQNWDLAPLVHAEALRA